MFNKIISPFACVLIAVFSLVSANPVIASENDSHWLFGVDFGVNYSIFEYSDVPDYWNPEWASGFTSGFFALYPANSRYQFQPSLRFIRLNNKVEIREVKTPEENSLGGQFEIVQDYISLATRLRIDRIVSKRLFCVIGPEFGLLVRAEHTYKSVHSVPPDPDRRFILTEVLDYYSAMKKLNVMLDVGIGISFDIEGHLGYWQVVYAHGITDNHEEIVPLEPRPVMNWKSREIVVSFGVSF